MGIEPNDYGFAIVRFGSVAVVREPVWYGR